MENSSRVFKFVRLLIFLHREKWELGLGEWEVVVERGMGRRQRKEGKTYKQNLMLPSSWF